MKRLAVLLILAGCGGGSGSPPAPPAAMCSAFLQWEAPTKRMDGTELVLKDIQKFTLFVSESPEPADMQIELIIEVTNPHLISWRVRDLSVRQHWFWVTATDTDNRESAPSNVEGKDC